MNHVIISSIDSLYDYIKDKPFHNLNDIKNLFESYKRVVLNDTKKKTRKSSPYNDFIKEKIKSLKDENIGLMENGKYDGKKLMRLAVKAWQEKKEDAGS